MTQYKSINVKWSNSQLGTLKYATKNIEKETLRISSNMIGNSRNETNFPQKLLLTDGQVASLHKAFENHLSANIKLSRTNS